MLDLEINEVGEIEVNNKLFVNADVCLREFLDTSCTQKEEKLEVSLFSLSIEEIRKLIETTKDELDNRIKAEDQLYEQNLKKLKAYKIWSIAGASVGIVATVAGVGLSVLFPLLVVPSITLPVASVFGVITSSGGIGLIQNFKAQKEIHKDRKLAINLISKTTEVIIEICINVILKKELNLIYELAVNDLKLMQA